MIIPEIKDSVSADPESFSDEVKTAGFWLWDNGEECKHRWLLSARFNLVDGTNLDFLVNLTKDFRNFKKHIPEEAYKATVEFADGFRHALRQHKVRPYIGKFRSSDKTEDKGMQLIEPYTAAVVWWSEDELGDKWWKGAVMIYDMMIQFDFENANITASQKQQGCKGYHKYTNPTHLKRKKTMAERRGKNYGPGK